MLILSAELSQAIALNDLKILREQICYLIAKGNYSSRQELDQDIDALIKVINVIELYE